MNSGRNYYYFYKKLKFYELSRLFINLKMIPFFAICHFLKKYQVITLTFI